ncbi:MAG: gliding motility-associated C-terminal domain-containing protein [Croceivirga sp.]
MVTCSKFAKILLKYISILFLFGFGYGLTAQNASITAAQPTMGEGILNPGSFQVSVVGGTPLSFVPISLSIDPSSTATVNQDYSINIINILVPLNILGDGAVAIPVNVIQDALVELDETVVLNLGASLNYTVVGLTSATVTISSDDVGSVTLSATDADAAETGLDAGEYTIDLGAVNATGSAIQVNYAYGGATQATPGTDFTTLPLSVNIPDGGQTATFALNPIEDSTVEGNEIVRLNLQSTSNLTLFPLGPVGAATSRDVTIADNDAAGFTLGTISGDTEEDGTTATFSVVLTAQPLTNVVFNVTTTDPGEGAVLPGSLTFTTANWNTTQTVTVTGVDDDIIDGSQSFNITVGINTALTDTAFDGLASQQAGVTNLDDDTADFTVSALTPNNRVSETGTQRTFSVFLAAQPASDVVLDIESNDLTEGFVDETSLTFTPLNWNTAQTVTVTGEDDVVVDGDQIFNVNVSVDASSSDDDFDGLATKAVAAVNEDDDIPGITIAQTGGSTETDEDETSDTFTVVLDAAPLSDVNLSLTSLNTDEVTVLPNTLLFTNANWNTPQVVTVTGVDDNFVDGTQTSDIRVRVLAGSSAIAYGGLADVLVSITNEDNDVAGINVTPITGTTTEAGGTASFRFTLTAEPTAQVTIPINQYDITETTGPASVTISPALWDTGVQLTITGLNDGIVDGDVEDIINTGNPFSLDLAFDDLVGVDVPQLTVTNEDIDSASLTITDISGDEDDGAISVDISLDTAVDGGFTIQVSTADGSATVSDNDYNPVNGQLLVFAGTASEVQSVNVLPIADNLIEPDEVLTLELSNLANTSLTVDISDSGTIGILNDDTCAAGIVAPVLNTSEPTTFCDFVSKDLDDYVVGAIPIGAVLAWSDSNTALTNESTHLSSSVVGVPDTYYGFYYDALNTCVSPALEVTLSASATPSAGTATNAAACSAVGDGPLSLDLDDQLTGQDAGVWSILTDPSSGNVVIGLDNMVNFQGLANGEYVFRYTTTGAIAPCVNASEDLTVTVTDCAVECDAGNSAPQRNTNVSTIFCDAIVEPIDLNGYVLDAAPTGSVLTWSTNSDPLRTEAHRSNFVTSPSTYYGFFFDDADGTNAIDCASPVLEITIQVNSTPAITDTTEAFRCGEGTVELFATAEIGASLNWYASLESTLVLGMGTSFVTPTLTVTTSFFVKAVANGCSSMREEVVATVNQIPSVGVPSGVIGCNRVGETGTTILDLTTALTDEDEGIWTITTDPSNGQVQIENGTLVDFDGLPVGNYVFTFTTTGAQSPCTNVSVDVTITVVDCLLDADNDGLNDDIEENLGTDPNNPDTDGDGILDGQEVNVDETDPLDDCDSNGGTPLGDSDCDNDGLTNNEEMDLQTDPFDADTDDDGLTDGEEVLVEDDPSTESVPEGVSDPLDSCDPFLTEACQPEPIDLEVTKEVDITTPLVNDEIRFTITVRNISMSRAIDITIADVLSDSSLFLIGDITTSSGIFEESTSIWTIDELESGASETLQITGTVPLRGNFTNRATLTGSFPEDNNIDNDSDEVSVLVSVSECVDCGTLCNLFSPNGDGVNDTLVLVTDSCNSELRQQIENNNSLQIFDRYGNSVFEASPYDGSWNGTGDSGDLPRGTYYYILDLGDGMDVQKGWIQIIR